MALAPPSTHRALLGDSRPFSPPSRSEFGNAESTRPSLDRVPIAIPRLARLFNFPGLDGGLAATQNVQILTCQELHVQLVLPSVAAIGQKLVKIANEPTMPMKGKAPRMQILSI
jgi:hypothetical protein